MKQASVNQTVFMVLVDSVSQKSCARLLIDSIRTFGGAMRDCPIWLFEAAPQNAPCQDMADSQVRVHPLTVPPSVQGYWFARKTYACARAEALADSSVRSLVWLSPDCLVIKPPVLFDLTSTDALSATDTSAFDIAVRPVHVTNIGLPITEPVDAFWQKVYETVGVQDIQTPVESFVEGQRIRAYFNSHALAVNPSIGLFHRWLEHFEALVTDQAFQRTACQDELHKIFLHQAVLSALIVTMLKSDRIRVLPPDYSYPYNLHDRVPKERRAHVLNDLVCPTYEGRSIDPDIVDDIQIHDPLRSWLSAHVKPKT